MSRFMDMLEQSVSQGTAPGATQEDPRNKTLLERAVDESLAQGGPAYALRDDSTSARFLKGKASPMSSTQVLARMQAVDDPDNAYALRFRDEDGNFSLIPTTTSLEEEYGEDFGALNPEERRKRIVETDKQNFEEKWANVPSEGAAFIGGAFTGAVVDDPLMSTVPLGGSVKAAAGIGAAVGATDAAMRSKFENGEIEWDTVALHSAVGAAGGGLIKAGGDAMANLVAQRAKQGMPVTTDEVGEVLGDSTPDVTNVQSAVDEINEHLDLGKKSWMNTVRAEIRLQGKGAVRVSPEEMIESISRGLDTFDQDLTSAQRASMTKAKRMYENLRDGGKPRKFQSTRKVKGEDTPITYTSGLDKQLEKAQEQYVSKIREFGARQQDEADYVENITPKSAEGVVDKAKVEDMGIETKPSSSSTAAVETAIKKKRVRTDTPLGRALYQEAGKIRNVEDLLEMGSKSVNSMAKAIGRPAAVIRDLGAVGREMTLRMARTHAEADRAFSLARRDIIDVQKKLNVSARQLSELSPEINGLLNKTMRPQEASREAVEFAREFRKFYNKAIHDAVDAGIYTKNQGSSLLKQAREKGYSPRMWDFDYLDSKQGKEKFIKTLTETPLSQRQVESAMSVMFKKSEIKSKKAGLKKTRSGKFVFSKEMAQSMWERRAGLKYRPKGNFLEKARVLDLPDEVVQPFLKQDSAEVLSEYIQDTYRSIGIAKHFGADGRVRGALLKSIKKNTDGRTYEFVKEWYATEVFDPGSKILQAARDISNKERTAIDVVRAANVPKLIAAQVLNLGQAWVNGMIRLSGDVGLPKAAAMSTKAMFDMLTKNGRDFASRTGAASQITIMQMLQEHGGKSGQWASAFLNWTQLPRVEQFQRLIGANMGKAYIEDSQDMVTRLLAQRAQRGLGQAEDRALKNAQDRLSELGLDPQRAGQYTAEELEIASNLFTNEINFRVGASSIPQAFNSPYGSVIRQFQTFVHAQTGFLKDAFKRSIKRNGVKGAVDMAAGIGLTPAMGAPIYYMRERFNAWAAGEEPDIDGKDAWLQGYVTVGALGMFLDVALRTGQTGPEKAAVGLLGPTVGGALNVAGGVAQSATSGEAEPLLKSLMGATLPKGYALSKRVFPEGGDPYGSSYQGMYQGR